MVGLMLKLRLTSQQRIPEESVAANARERANEIPEVQPWMSKRERDKDRDWARGVRQ